ncbi:TetR/AcrR family transcriptional regulator [Streptomyces diacarni]|uniref:TetR/AcrR family transcriptional regulator n=1 Tax=Streptomyces diacarni TaxID=2800381 RepID=UPI001FEA84FE|nr:TetR/AcrR family transcriptional regulator [Streptomyces diacarni]
MFAEQEVAVREEPPSSIWLRPVRAGKGPAPTFAREDLAAAGVALADEQGLAAVTMRAVARALASAPASLYRYVTTRDELLELMVDKVHAEMDVPSARSGPGADRRRPVTGLLALARESRRLHLAHPWLLDATATRRPLGPHGVAYLEQALAVLADTPGSARSKLEAIGVMNAVVASLSRAELDQAAAGRGALPQWQQAQHAYLTALATDGDHPHLVAALAAGQGAAAGQQAAGQRAGGVGGVDGVGEESAEALFDRLVTRVLAGLLAPEDGGPAAMSD